MCLQATTSYSTGKCCAKHIQACVRMYYTLIFTNKCIMHYASGDDISNCDDKYVTYKTLCSKFQFYRKHLDIQLHRYVDQ